MSKTNFKRELHFFDIPKNKIVIGLVIWLLFSFLFYAFVFVLRESLRLLTINEYYDLVILSDKEMWFYNFFFALIATIFGQSICFSFWLSGPRSFLRTHNYLRTNIIHDQRLLNTYFLHWFSKLAITIIGALYIPLKQNISFNIYKDYKWALILVVVVLFTQTWNSIRHVYKLKSFKWQLYATLFITLTAYGLSHINLINYKELNQVVLNKNIFYSFNLQLPQLECSNYTCWHGRPYQILYVVKKTKDVNHHENIIIMDNEEISKKDFRTKVKTKLSDIYPSYYSSRIRYELYIDQNVDMKFINWVKEELSYMGIYKVGFAFIPTNDMHKTTYSNDATFSYRLPFKPTIPPPPGIKPSSNIIEIKHLNNKLIVNDQVIELNNLNKKLYQLIEKNSDHLINYFVDDKLLYKDYLSILTITKNVIDQLRDSCATSRYNMSFEDLDYEYQKEIRYRFPYRIKEICNESN